MPEGFDPSDAPVRRGRRDPELALALEQNLGASDETDAATGEYGLAVGDEVVYKLTVLDPDPVHDRDRWFTYGLKSSVLPGEEEASTFTRVVSLVHGRLDEAIEHQNAIAVERAEEARRRPIVPQP